MGQHSPTDSLHRSRKRKAILAGGVVLGLGAAATLAAWTDDVWVSGSFTAGSFNVQGAVNGMNWAEMNTPGTAGGLTFTVAPTAMTPGQSVYAPINLRVGPSAGQYDASITLPTAPSGPAISNAANNAFFSALRLSIYNVAPDNCNAAGTTGATVSGFSSVALTTVTTSQMITLNKNTTPNGLCFKVTLPSEAPTTVQGGTTGALTWNLRAASIG